MQDDPELSRSVKMKADFENTRVSNSFANRRLDHVDKYASFVFVLFTPGMTRLLSCASFRVSCCGEGYQSPLEGRVPNYINTAGRQD